MQIEREGGSVYAFWAMVLFIGGLVATGIILGLVAIEVANFLFA